MTVGIEMGYTDGWTTIQSTSGHSVQVRRQVMPSLPNQLLSTVVYLYPTVEAADANKRSGGTGFAVAIHSPHQRFRHKYLVTNAHVIEHGNTVVRINTVDGKTDTLPLREEDWYPHLKHDDIAVAPIQFNHISHHYRAIGEKMFLHRHLVNEIGIGAGHDVFMIGRFSGFQGSTQNLPSMRFGNIAMMPLEPVLQIDRKFPNEDGVWQPFQQESYIVEMRSISGFSGSPVFVYNTGVEPSYSNVDSFSTFKAPFMMLLGVDWGHFSGSDGNNANISGVVPAWKLHELLYDERLVKMREEEDKRLDEEGSEDGAVLDVLEEDESVFTKADFLDVLNKVSQPNKNQKPDK